MFDYTPGDVFGCVADIGWITGHSYVVYGPLCNGATSVLFESTPMYPNPGEISGEITCTYEQWFAVCIMHMHSISFLVLISVLVTVVYRHDKKTCIRIAKAFADNFQNI